MPALMLRCKRCGMIFSCGVNVGASAKVTFDSSEAQCPSCGLMNRIPDGTFEGTVEGIIRFLNASTNPLQEAIKIFDVLENSRKKGSLEEITKQPWYSSLSKWLPNTPEKLAAYAAIIGVIIQILSKNPEQKIEYSQFIKVYNQTIVIQNQNSIFGLSNKKIGRNESCPCGSGKKYKHCHGKSK